MWHIFAAFSPGVENSRIPGRSVVSSLTLTPWVLLRSALGGNGTCITMIVISDRSHYHLAWRPKNTWTWSTEKYTDCACKSRDTPTATATVWLSRTAELGLLAVVLCNWWSDRLCVPVCACVSVFVFVSVCVALCVRLCKCTPVLVRTTFCHPPLFSFSFSFLPLSVVTVSHVIFSTSNEWSGNF